MQEGAAGDGWGDGAGEAIVEQVEASEIREEADGGGDGAADEVVVKVELPEGGELGDPVRDPTSEPPPWELDGDDLPLSALDPFPAAGAGAGAGVVPPPQKPSPVHQPPLERLQALVIRLGDDDPVPWLP